MEEMVEIADDSELKVTPGKKTDSGIFSTRYSGFFQEGTPLTGSHASDLDHSRYSDLNLSNMQVRLSMTFKTNANVFCDLNVFLGTFSVMPFLFC
jgi:hypothetical protein